MKLDFNELEKGICEELHNSSLAKTAFWPLVIGAGAATAAGVTGVPWLTNKIAPDLHKKWSENPKNVLYATGAALNKGVNAVGSVAANVNQVANAAPGILQQIKEYIPKITDTVGTVAPLALGAMVIPSLMGQRQQSSTGTNPVVINNYMGQKPNMLSPHGGVQTIQDAFGKTGEAHVKTADVISKAIADAAKRRMANRVLDVVSPEAQPQEKSKEEIEIVTKYPEMAKLLEDEQNRAYLNRLLAH